MRLTQGRARRLLATSAGAVLLAAVGLSADPVCRRLAESAAAKRSVTLRARHAWLTWSGLRIQDAEISAVDVPGVALQLASASVDWGPFSGVTGVSVDGARLRITGSPAELAVQVARWRSHQAAGPAASTRRRRLRLSFSGADVAWDDGEASHVEVRGISGARGPDGLSLTVESATGSRGALRLDLRGLSVEADAADSLKVGHASALSVAWDGARRPEKLSTVAVVGPSADQPVHAADVATPLLELPDLRAAQSAAMHLAALLGAHLPQGVKAAVDAVSWRIAPRTGSAMTLGPGALTVSHDADRVQVDFGAGATDGGPAVTARLSLPTGAGDSSLDLQGGPVALGALGVQDGNAGLFDVGRTTVSGKAHLAVDAEARGLTFDGAASARSVSVRDPRLASDDVRGLDVQVRARGALSLPGQLRLDELAATVGALHVEASGVLDQEADHVSAAFRFAVPTTACNVALNSIPTALLPIASGMTFRGTIGAEGRVAFDSRSLDDLELAYQVHDGCVATAVPSMLSHDSLGRPFVYRVYLPDGTTQDEETGPGTAGWTPLAQISPFMDVALMTLEDGAFRSHHGFNQGAIRASIIANLKARRFVRGASTLTMQLAKNLFLSREKTLSRKLEEVILTDYLEQILSKDEILELYLNVVEFGPAVYGITAAADYYFGRLPSDLDLAEAFFLGSLLPSPIRLSAVRDSGTLPESRAAALRSLMRVARKRNLIGDADLSAGLAEEVTFWRGGDKPPPHTGVPTRTQLDVPGRASPELDTPAGDLDSSP